MTHNLLPLSLVYVVECGCGCRSAAVTTLRFDGSQYFRTSLSDIRSRDLTTYNMSLSIRTRQSDCHLMTLTSSRLNDAQLTLSVVQGRVKLGLPSHPSSSSSLSAAPFTPSFVSFIFLLINFLSAFLKILNAYSLSCLPVFPTF